jgi:acyl-CoA thioester hydrolase
MTLLPASGERKDGVFAFPIRVYYEDTDVGGMVYHARYVSFFERVRSESIRGTAADVNALFDIPETEGGPLTYVVSKIAVSYHAQAKVGDILIGYSTVKKVRAAAIEIEQWIERDGERIASAELIVAIVDKTGRPQRWPIEARKCWQDWMEEAPAP